MKKTIYLFLLSLFIFSCSSDDDKLIGDLDYLIFGHFYGECFGETCIETFKLENEKLFEDSNDNYASGPYNFEVLENDKFELVKDLIDSLPSELLSNSETTIGCPDCADGGGIFIEFSINGIVKNYTIDQSKNDIPSYLHDFTDKVNEKIDLINK
jgi:hypothetical protein